MYNASISCWKYFRIYMYFTLVVIDSCSRLSFLSIGGEGESVGWLVLILTGTL